MPLPLMEIAKFKFITHMLSLKRKLPWAKGMRIMAKSRWRRPLFNFIRHAAKTLLPKPLFRFVINAQTSRFFDGPAPTAFKKITFVNPQHHTSLLFQHDKIFVKILLNNELMRLGQVIKQYPERFWWMWVPQFHPNPDYLHHSCEESEACDACNRK